MAKKIKVLQFVHDYSMPYKEIAKQYRQMLQCNCEVITIFLIGEENLHITKHVGGKVIYLNNTSSEVRGLKRKQISQLKRLNHFYQFDFAIAHRFKPAYIISHACNIPMLVIHHGYGDYRRYFRKRYAYKYQKKIYLAGVSNAIREDIRKDLPKFSPDRIITLYNQIDAEGLKNELLTKLQAREYLHLPADAFIFANVGRLHADKDQLTLLKAFARIYKYCQASILLIIGSGSLENKLKQVAKDLQIDKQVVFLGFIADVYRYFCAFDRFVLSSDHEPFGMVLLEAMVANIPIIATNAGGIPEIIHHTDWLFPVGDDEKLADCLLKSYQLSKQQLSIIILQMQERLNHHFTSQVIAANFWQWLLATEIFANLFNSKTSS